MRSLKLCLLLLTAATCDNVASRAKAQPTEPRGIIVYKSSSFDSDDRALAAEYTEIKLFPKIVHGQKSNGSAFQIVSSEFVDYVEYPDLKQGVFKSPQQIESFKATGRKMVEISKKFSSSQAILAPRIEGMKLAAGKFSQGFVLVNGEWQAKNEEGQTAKTGNTDGPAPEAAKNPNEILHYNGKQVQGIVTSVDAVSVNLRTDTGIIRVPLSGQPDDVKTKFGYSEENAIAFLEDEEKRRRELIAQQEERRNMAAEIKTAAETTPEPESQNQVKDEGTRKILEMQLSLLKSQLSLVKSTRAAMKSRLPHNGQRIYLPDRSPVEKEYVDLGKQESALIEEISSLKRQLYP